MGDFNEMTSIFEKDGLRRVEPIRLNLFRDFFNESNLIDLELHGCKFTWVSNPRDGFVTWERIDRVLSNWAWRDSFPHALSLALPIVNSNHSPIILRPKPPLTSGKSLRYESFWDDHEDCKKIVAEGWDGILEDPWGHWNRRVTNCKTHLTMAHSYV